ncbi:hypothetical protein BGZ97_007793 [Linnemannia gamsii]|uniref:Enoyl reductase (ER) domain-containing protein n=1 Tax=Linnemannia gamsii TaxID=64522 RepID=A0A9P6UET1_9FUNG|nr:hypothetical protein BGZ97_007793 [Linnemannia gamsii]
MKAIIVEKTNFEPTYHNAKLVDIPKPELTEDGQALLDMHAVAFNHREIWIRKGVYPVIVFDTILGADGVGRIAEVKGNLSKHRVGDRVVVMPSVGWTKDPRGPEEDYYIIGGGPAPGVFSEHFVGKQDDLFKVPDHLTDAEAAALPLAGLTAWRAVFTKGQVRQGQNVLITGIGGGVALMTLLFCVAAGANVYVNSSDDAKILKAIELGARGGVNYKTDKWVSQLQQLAHGEPFDVVIDGAGGDGFKSFTNLLRMGGIIVSYGMTVKFEVDYSMHAVLRNIEVRGSTMGSRVEFGEMVDFVEKHKIKPVVSQVWPGLESAEEAFKVLRAGTQFGKLVLSLKDDSKL